MRIVLVVGARPNFMKIAPTMAEIGKCPELVEPILVHTKLPITIQSGTNILVGSDERRITENVFRILDGRDKKGQYSRRLG